MGKLYQSFPTDADADGAEVFATSATEVKELKAWVLDVDASQSGADRLTVSEGFDNAAMTVYNLQGIAVKTSVEASEALSDLPAGIYIVNGRKVLKKLQ